MGGIAVDTNILVYAAGLKRVADDEFKIAAAALLIGELTLSDELRLPAQALAELRHVLIRRSGWKEADIDQHLSRFLDMEQTLPTDHPTMQSAFMLAAEHRLQTYDAIVLASAALAGCDVLYSEDMQHGFEWSGVKVVNPFA